MIGLPFVYAGAAFCVTGCILNAVVNTQGSRLAFRASIAPYIIYSAGLPLLAIANGATLRADRARAPAQRAVARWRI